MNFSILIGNPVEHSISDYLFEQLNFRGRNLKDYAHQKKLVESNFLEHEIKKYLKEPDCIGLNITLPYKRKVLKYIDNLDESVEIIGSANNIYKIGNSAIGTNTDWIGIYNTLDFFCATEIRKCCILGTGGTCRATIFALQKYNISPIIVYREPISDNTLSLMEDFPSLQYILYQELPKQITDVELVINTTPVGMIGNKDSLPVELEVLDTINLKEKCLLDVVFNPLHTKIYKYFSERGAKTIDGLWVMIFQGIAAYVLWGNEVSTERYFAKDFLLQLHNYLERKLEDK